MKESHVPRGLNGLCESGIRRLTWSNADDGDFSPLLLNKHIEGVEGEISIEFLLHHITSATDYQIFDAFRLDDISLLLDFIQQRIGINAVDEWGQSPLITAVVKKQLPVVSGLLNSFNPVVNVNFAKPSGFTALIYAVQYSEVGILSALLKKGADPNLVVSQEVGVYVTKSLTLEMVSCRDRRATPPCTSLACWRSQNTRKFFFIIMPIHSQ